MNNKDKIEKLENEIKALSREYNEIRDKWKYMEASLNLRDIEIRNKCLEAQNLRDANCEGGENDKRN